MHRYHGICLMAEENTGKAQLGDRQMNAMRSVIASNGGSYLQMRSVGSHSTSGIEEEGKDVVSIRVFRRGTMNFQVYMLI